MLMHVITIMWCVSLFPLLPHSTPHPHPTPLTDGTACVWDVESSNLLLKYVGHSGSVNSISFHPHEPLACTASGDSSTHVWNCSVSIPRQRTSAAIERIVRVSHIYTVYTVFTRIVAAATINFALFSVQLLIEGGYY